MRLAGEMIGAIAVAEGFFIYYSNKRERMLVFKFVSDALWLINYLLLGGVTGAIINAVAMVRETVFFCRDKVRFAGSFIWPILFALAAAISPMASLISGKEGWYALFPAIGSTVAALAFYQRSPARVRALGAFAQAMWLLYAICILNISAMVCNSVLLLSAAAGAVRALVRKRSEAAREASDNTYAV